MASAKSSLGNEAADSPNPTNLLSCDYGSGKRENYLNWDDYFMAVALLSAKRSKDPVTQVGACIVDGDQRIVGIGYNGFPRACHDDKFSWRKRRHNSDSDTVGNPLEDKSLYVVHAEANAILNKNAISISGTRLYTTLFPCNECAKLIIQSGICEILYLSDAKAKKRTYCASKLMLNAADVTYRRFTPAQQQIVISFDFN